ncbi:protein NEOXANTHIN-DEFICIENT 1-like isoform X2 [Coffea arabica]|uniref:Protein NEOXANTHIN-DEFICIENT 1-like isoform X2 n=1 Tax=Coffea arabica TaxID=13443 RepID=A0ABM4W516_COFAR
MDHRKTHSPSGYGKPPWVFRGSALYQLHLVKAETARAFIPKEFRLVEAFGYTLGGFFLANYDDSPAGKFDELVVIAGTVWNPPTSCAWAARVLVNSDEACIHGQKDIGLPSQVAKFSKTVRAIAKTSETKTSGFLNMVGMFSLDGPKNSMDVQVSEMKGMEEMNICNINFSAPASELESSGWMGPLVKLSLPSFSGRTKYNRHLLKYSCQIECRVRAVAPAKVLGPPPPAVDVDEERSCRELRKKKRSLSVSVLLSKPILALQFNRLEMKVEAPTTVCKR